MKTSVAASPSTSARQSGMTLDYIGSNLRQQVQHRLECGAVGEDIRRHACKSRISADKFRTKSDDAGQYEVTSPPTMSAQVLWSNSGCRHVQPHLQGSHRRKQEHS